MLRIISVSRSFVVAALVAAGCTKGGKFIEVTTADGSSAKLAVTESLRVNLNTEPSTLNWTIASDSTSTEVTTNLMDGLVLYDLYDKDMKLVPGLALKWEPSEEARRWKFTLREGVVWNDGVPFTPQHAIDGWKYLLTKSTASSYSYFLFGIKNARAFHEGKVEWNEVGAKITGPNEISVELERPMSYFPYLLTHHSTWPVRMDVIEKHGAQWAMPGKIVTLGPYNLKSWEHDHLIALERNESYYGEKAKIKNVVNYMIIEQATAINLYESGKLDVVSQVPSVERRKLRGRKDFYEEPTLSLYYYGMNVTKPPMNDANVRKAIAHAIDRNEIIRMLGGGQAPTSSWVPKGMFGFEENIGLKFDPAKARQLIAKAGYKNGVGFPRIELAFNQNEDHQRIAENVQAQLKRNLGISVELRNVEWKVYISQVKTDAPQLFRYGWLADYPDPDNYLALMTGYSENNHTKWKSARFDEYVIEGSSLVDLEKRRKVYAQAQKLLVEEEVPAIPILTSTEGMLVSPRITGFPHNVMRVRSYKGVSLK